MNFGAPATNATIPKEVSLKIEMFASAMEITTTTTPAAKNYNKNNAVSSKLSGSWRLLYTNAPEIRSLAKGLPLGFRLGPTYQPFDSSSGYFENRARLDHPYRLAALQTIVVGTVSPGTIGSFNAIGIENKDNNRVDIDFDLIVFQLDEILGKTLDTPIRKTLIPTTTTKKKVVSSVVGTPGDNEAQATTKAVLPANDQTYLDDKIRIVRGGDGSLFIFSRDESDEASSTTSMMTVNERDELFGSANNNKKWSFAETTPLGEELKSEQQQDQTTSNNIPVEIEFLFKERRK